MNESVIRGSHLCTSLVFFLSLVLILVDGLNIFLVKDEGNYGKLLLGKKTKELGEDCSTVTVALSIYWVR